MDNKMLFSIVTVCYNAADTIEATMESVLNQSYANFEYIIMDGASADGTVQKINRVLQDYHLKQDAVSCHTDGQDNIQIQFVSEPDRGLYHAMNKAITKCEGQYVLFMNSGDGFYDEHVLEYVSSEIQNRAEDDLQDAADIYYGDVERVYNDHHRIERYYGKYIVMKLLLAGRMPCHQSMFVKTQIMKMYGFDESYTITADYNFLMRCKKERRVMKYLPLIVSTFECEEGISSQKSNLNQMREQDDRSMKTFFPVWYYLLRPVKFLKRKLLG